MGHRRRRPGAADELDSLAADAERRGWADVVRVGLYAAITSARVASRLAGRELVPEAVEALRLRCEADGDPTMLAVALTFQVSSWLEAADPSVLVAADRELAKATVLLEAGSGSPLERVVADNRCASAHEQRGLWELADEQYGAAETLLPECGGTRYSAALRFNRAELLLDWACALREIEETPALRQLCSGGLAAVAAAARRTLPCPHGGGGRAPRRVATLLAALAGRDQEWRRPRLLAGGAISPDYEGHLHLAVALAYPCVGGSEAATEVSWRPSSIPSKTPSRSTSCAFRVAAESNLPDPEGPTATAGMRYGQRQVEQRGGGPAFPAWRPCSPDHASERLVAERRCSRRDAFLDESRACRTGADSRLKTCPASPPAGWSVSQCSWSTSTTSSW